jgi:hypothetical protein
MDTSTTEGQILFDFIEAGSAGLYDHKDAPKQERNITGNHLDATKQLHQFLIGYI